MFSSIRVRVDENNAYIFSIKYKYSLTYFFAHFSKKKKPILLLLPKISLEANPIQKKRRPRSEGHRRASVGPRANPRRRNRESGRSPRRRRRVRPPRRWEPGPGPNQWMSKPRSRNKPRRGLRRAGRMAARAGLRGCPLGARLSEERLLRQVGWLFNRSGGFWGLMVLILFQTRPLGGERKVHRRNRKGDWKKLMNRRSETVSFLAQSD